MSGTLYIVATPIGNLADITLRAIDTLRAADRVAAEDTRRARGLLSHLGIAGKPVDRLDANASEADVARIVSLLAGGATIALVTDAGTPVVSDPGTALVAAAAREGIRVVPIPGPSAVTAALAASGLADGPFRFIGFLPRSGDERREAIAQIAADPDVVVLFESPARIGATLEDLARAMPSRRAALGRELTKMHEEILRGALAELALREKDREWLGEITLVIGPFAGAGETAGPTDEELDRRIDEELARGRRAKDIAEALAVETGRPRRGIYQRVLARKG